MMPRKIIDSRKQSPPARCQREIGRFVVGYATPCGAQLQLVVTRNPTHTPYDELVIVRCCAGHIERGDGVLPDEQHSDYDIQDYGAEGV